MRKFLKKPLFNGTWDYIQFLAIGVFLDEYFKRNGYTIESYDTLLRMVCGFAVWLELLFWMFKKQDRDRWLVSL